jgi:TRAP-type C4-dicarboxylate transport system permease large subunit
MNAGGLSRRIVRVAVTMVGHVHGGLGYVAIFAAVVMASLSVLVLDFVLTAMMFTI